MPFTWKPRAEALSEGSSVHFARWFGLGGRSDAGVVVVDLDILDGIEGLLRE